MPATEPMFDFGDPELNDPDYESKVGGIDATTDSPADTVTQEPAVTAPVTTPQSAPAQGDAGTGTDGAGGKPGPQSAAPVGGTRSDDKGNLVDAKGNIVAAAGAERRHFERVQQQARYIKTLERDIEAARAGANSVTALNGLPAQLKLVPDEATLGMQFMSAFKTNPVEAARWALQETMRLGYNLQQIVGAAPDGKPIGGSMDLSAVKAMINEAVAPLVGDRQAQAQAAELDAQVDRTHQEFVAKHEHASVHDDVLAAMLDGDDKLSPEAAYWQLSAYAAHNGLDFSQPLRAQMLARQGQPQQPASNGNAQPSNAQHQFVPMPNGSAMTADTQQSDGMASPDDSWDQIVRTSMHNAGYN